MKHNLALQALLVPMSAMVAPVYAVDYFNLEEVQQQLFPDASSFADVVLHFDRDQRKAIRRAAGTRQRGDEQIAWQALRDGELLGWVLVDNVIGKHEFITYAISVSPAGEVLGLEIMSYRETHGGEVRQADWRNQFTGKTGDDELELGEGIANISGATLSCRNVTDGVKRLLVIWDMFLSEA